MRQRPFPISLRISPMIMETTRSQSSRHSVPWAGVIRVTQNNGDLASFVARIPHAFRV